MTLAAPWGTQYKGGQPWGTSLACEWGVYRKECCEEERPYHVLTCGQCDPDTSFADPRLTFGNWPSPPADPVGCSFGWDCGCPEPPTSVIVPWLSGCSWKHFNGYIVPYDCPGYYFLVNLSTTKLTLTVHYWRGNRYPTRCDSYTQRCHYHTGAAPYGGSVSWTLTGTQWETLCAGDAIELECDLHCTKHCPGNSIWTTSSNSDIVTVQF